MQSKKKGDDEEQKTVKYTQTHSCPHKKYILKHTQRHTHTLGIHLGLGIGQSPISREALEHHHR